MTIGWIYEGDWDRWYETVGGADYSIDTGPISATCSICQEKFADQGSLARHYSLSHPLERPVLLIDGRERTQNDLITTRIRPEYVTALGCTKVRLSIDGRPSEPIAPERIGAYLAPLQLAHARIELVNHRLTDDARTETRYELSIRVPAAEKLRKIDESFVRSLAHDSLSLGAVRRFCEDLGPLNAEGEYVDGLAAYVKGVLTKDQSRDSGITLPFATYADHFRQSVRVLAMYSTPVARLITRVIQLNLNELTANQPATGAPALDKAYDLFLWLGGGQPKTSETGRRPVLQTNPACPTDHTTERLLQIASNWPDLTETDLWYLDGASRSEAVAMVDRTKAAALRFAYDHLKDLSTASFIVAALQNDPVFSCLLTATTDC